jgi:hypothetical protein
MRRTHGIRQRNVFRHDATPMTLRFCSYTTQTPVTILVLKLGRSETGREKRVMPEFGERKEEKNSTIKFRVLHSLCTKRREGVFRLRLKKMLVSSTAKQINASTSVVHIEALHTLMER